MEEVVEGGGVGWYFWGVRTEKGTDRTPRAMQRFSGWNGAFLPSLPAPCLHHPGKKTTPRVPHHNRLVVAAAAAEGLRSGR